MAITPNLAPLGRFEGPAVIMLLPDGRRVQLVQAFAYVDPGAVRWGVPAGAIVDGASIPQAFWHLVGGPFEGKYRDASIVHDWYCDLRTRPWRAVHRVFYDAMLTSGVDPARAKLMYAAVLLGGPRWSDTVVQNTNLISGSGVKGPAPGAGEFEAILRLARRPLSERPRVKAPARLAAYRYELTDSGLEAFREQVAGLDVAKIEKLVDQKVKSMTRERVAYRGPALSKDILDAGLRRLAASDIASELRTDHPTSDVQFVLGKDMRSGATATRPTAARTRSGRLGGGPKGMRGANKPSRG